MKKKIAALVILAGVLAAAFPACTAEEDPGPEPEDVLIRPAPIEEVDVRFAESYPIQVFVYIRGGLSDGCTEFYEHIVTRDGNDITIDVSTIRPADAMCTEQYRTFEKNVALGTDFVSGETYTVKVNEVTETFVMQ